MADASEKTPMQKAAQATAVLKKALEDVER